MAIPENLTKKLSQLEENINQVIIGKERVVKFALVTLLCQGHLLLEDVPGVGKTMLAKALARSIDAQFKRVQCTPDLLPTDVTGVSIFNQKSHTFEFNQGPVFTNILLADEVNRATPRTQSALLECMAEGQVTVDGTTHKLSELFFVISTQNPIEQQGTFPLPEAQLDRFFMCLSLGYPDAVEEVEILNSQVVIHPIEKIESVITVDEVIEIQHAIRKVHIDDDVKKYLVSIVRATRSHKDVILGASPRASLALMRGAQACAIFQDQDFVHPQMIVELAPYILGHRIIVNPQSRLSGITAGEIVSNIVNGVVVPTGYRD